MSSSYCPYTNEKCIGNVCESCKVNKAYIKGQKDERTIIAMELKKRGCLDKFVLCALHEEV